MALVALEIAPVVQRHWLGETARRHPTVMIGVMLLLAMAAMALLAPYLGTVDPLAVGAAGESGSGHRPSSIGSEPTGYGRDVYSRTLYGAARVSLTVSLSVAMFGTALGLAIGLVTGFVRRLDFVVMRLMDALMSIPPVLLAIALMALTKASLGNVVLAITIAEVPRVARLVAGDRAFAPRYILSSKRRWRRAPDSGALCSATSSPAPRSRRC